MEDIIKYKGVLTQSIIGTCMNSIEENISHTVTMANTSVILIEMCQNMMNYSKSPNINCNDIIPDGSICVQEDDGTYYITGRNIVSEKDKKTIEPKVLEVQSLDKAGIKKRYKELRKSGKNTHAKGGGIGTYEIAKICDEIEYDFEFINENRYYFTLKSIIRPKVRKTELKTILIIESDKKMQQALENMFKNKNYNVILASNTNDVLDILDDRIVDLMILDNNLEESNAMDFLMENYNKIINLLKIPVFVTSNNSSPEIIKNAYTHGAIELLLKPLKLDELIIKVDMRIDYRIKELKNKETLKILNEYKKAVDESAIVTKTDTKGIITYANDQFCEISGYSREELIGQSHNIVRHQDVDKSIYEDLWNTIKVLKKPWRGEIKNKKKDGSYYWVKSFIKPILDIDRNIVEYIAIRVDITELKDLKL